MIPNLSLSTGPAISGGPTSAGGGYTGAFNVGETWQQSAAKWVPLAVMVGGLWWLTRKR